MKIVRLIVVLSMALVPQMSMEARADTGDVVFDFVSPAKFPTGMTYDGSHLWLADRKNDLLYRVDPKNGKVVKQLQAPGYFSTGLAWDGSHVWVADMDFTDTSTEDHTGKIYQICPKTGRTVKRIEAPYRDPSGLAWDGEYLWMTDNIKKKIVCLSPQDGTTVVEFPSPGKTPTDITWDGSYLWVADRFHNEIHRVHPKSGAVVMTIPSPGPHPWGLTWVKKHLWNVDYQTDRVYKLKIFDRSLYRRTNQRMALMSFNHEVLNLGPGSIERLNTYIAVPKNRPNQDIIDIVYESKPLGFVQDQWAQRIAHFQTDQIEARGKSQSVMTVRADLFEVWYHIFPEKVGKLSDIPKDIRRQYLQDGMKYRIQDPVIQQATQAAVKGAVNPYWIARNIFDSLRDRLHYVREGGWNVAPTVLQRGSGSCSEYTFVFISMCRAAGLPARYVGAVVMRDDAASMDYVFHRWPEVYLPGYGWVPTDAQAGDKESPREQAMAFGHLDSKFLITTEGGGESQFLQWGYNATENWIAKGPVQLRIETIADWEPAMDKPLVRGSNLSSNTKGLDR